MISYHSNISGPQSTQRRTDSHLGGMLNSCPKFTPIHAASFEGSQRRIGWDLRNGYWSHAILNGLHQTLVHIVWRQISCRY